MRWRAGLCRIACLALAAWAVFSVDAEARTVHVYGSYGTAQEVMQDGPIDPLASLEEIRDEYKAGAAERIRAGLAALPSTGWAVNPGPRLP